MSEARTVKGLILQINLGDKEERFLAQDLLVAKFQDLEKENGDLKRKLEIAKSALNHVFDWTENVFYQVEKDDMICPDSKDDILVEIGSLRDDCGLFLKQLNELGE